jgi:hypothetical protein
MKKRGRRLGRGIEMSKILGSKEWETEIGE